MSELLLWALNFIIVPGGASLLLEAVAPSAVMTYGSQRNCSRLVMVHWPTTGFLPNGLWSITLSTMGGVYISSFGSSWWEAIEEREKVQELAESFPVSFFGTDSCMTLPLPL